MINNHTYRFNKKSWGSKDAKAPRKVSESGAVVFVEDLSGSGGERCIKHCLRLFRGPSTSTFKSL